METQCVYHEFTTKLPIFHSVSAHPLCTMVGFDLKAIHVRFVLYKLALDSFLSRVESCCHHLQDRK